MNLRAFRFAGAALAGLALVAGGLSVSSCVSTQSRLAAPARTEPPAPYPLRGGAFGAAGG